MTGYIITMLCVIVPAFMLVKSITELVKMKTRPDLTVIDVIVQITLIAFYTVSVIVVSNIAAKTVSLLLYFG